MYATRKKALALELNLPQEPKLPFAVLPEKAPSLEPGIFDEETIQIEVLPPASRSDHRAIDVPRPANDVASSSERGRVGDRQRRDSGRPITLPEIGQLLGRPLPTPIIPMVANSNALPTPCARDIRFERDPERVMPIALDITIKVGRDKTMLFGSDQVFVPLSVPIKQPERASQTLVPGPIYGRAVEPAIPTLLGRPVIEMQKAEASAEPTFGPFVACGTLLSR